MRHVSPSTLDTHQKDNSSSKLYNLFGIVEHHIKANGGGHYTAVTNKTTENLWHAYDDDRVEISKFANRKQNKAMMSFQRTASTLFYKLSTNDSGTIDADNLFHVELPIQRTNAMGGWDDKSDNGSLFPETNMKDYQDSPKSGGSHSLKSMGSYDTIPVEISIIKGTAQRALMESSEEYSWHSSDDDDADNKKKKADPDSPIKKKKDQLEKLAVRRQIEKRKRSDTAARKGKCNDKSKKKHYALPDPSRIRDRGCNGDFFKKKIFLKSNFSQLNGVRMVCRMSTHQERH